MTQPTFSTSRHREDWLQEVSRLGVETPAWRTAEQQNREAASAALDELARAAWNHHGRPYAPRGLFSIVDQVECVHSGARYCPCLPGHGSDHCDPTCVEYHSDACMRRGWPRS